MRFNGKRQGGVYSFTDQHRPDGGKMIHSHLLQIALDASGRVFLVFDTVFQSKHLLTACGVGRIQKGQVQITPTAQGTLDALCAYAQSHQPGRLHMMEIATVAAAAVRVRRPADQWPTCGRR